MLRIVFIVYFVVDMSHCLKDKTMKFDREYGFLKIVPVILLICLLFVHFFSKDVKAMISRCTLFPEMIVTLKPYKEPHYILRNYVYGVENHERFNDLVGQGNGNIIAAGYRISDDNRKEPLLVMINGRNRIAWSNKLTAGQDFPLSSQMSAKRIFQNDDGSITVFGNFTSADGNKSIWIGNFDQNGKSDKIRYIDDNSESLIEDAVISADGKHYILAVTIYDELEDGGIMTNGSVYKIDMNGNIIWKRGYKPGNNNLLKGIVSVRRGKDSSIHIAAGEITSMSGVTSGIVVAIDDEGGLDWSRQLSRGVASSLQDITLSQNRYIIATGSVEPIGENYLRSGWLIKLNIGNGDPVWERYASLNDREVFGRKITSYDDGRVAVVNETVKYVPKYPDINNDYYETNNEDEKDSDEGYKYGDKLANAPEDAEFIRVITVSPMGEFLDDTAILEGKAVKAEGISLDKYKRLMIAGYAVDSAKARNEDDKKNYMTEDGWFAVLPGAGNYNNPCPDELDDINVMSVINR